MGYGERPYGNNPYGDDSGITSLAPRAECMVESLLQSAWDSGDEAVSDIWRQIQVMSRYKSGMILSSQQNSCLQTYLLKIIEDEARTIPETLQHQLAVQALLDLQDPDVI